MLDSATNQLTASFGSMAVTGEGDDRSISLELHDYYSEAETIINGTGTGTMTFSTTSEDEDGTSGTRTFTNVPITPDTMIRVIRSNSATGAVTLEIYTDNGNTLKEVWYADGNSPSVSALDEGLTEWYLYGDTGEDVNSGNGGNTSNSSSNSDPSYSPVMNVSDGGTVSVNPRTPSEGDKVTLTVTPDDDYEVGEVIVTDRNGREIDITANRDGTYSFEQPRGPVTIEVTFVRTGESTFFADVLETFWAYNEIEWAYENGYVNGTTTTTFSPNSSISRQQVWMILARLSGADPADMAEARTWAINNGISDGTTPGAAVTRQQLVALLYRYAQMMGYANEARVDLSSFPDAGSVASYAVEPMQWSVANSIVGGTTDGTLNPTGTATRAQFAVILYRFWSQIG